MKTPLCPRDDADKLCLWNKSFQAVILEKWSCDGSRSVLQWVVSPSRLSVMQKGKCLDSTMIFWKRKWREEATVARRNHERATDTPVPKEPRNDLLESNHCYQGPPSSTVTCIRVVYIF